MTRSRWDRIVALRSKLQKQAEAAVRAREAEHDAAKAALAKHVVQENTPASRLQSTEFLRGLMLAFENQAAASLADERATLLNKAIACKQAESLQRHHQEEEERTLDKRDQTFLDSWQRGRRIRRLL
jgi:hypothetical protein